MSGRWGQVTIALALAARAAVAQPAVAAAALEDPCRDGGEATCRHRALDGFFAALAANEAGTAAHPVRITWVGDSLTAEDGMEARLRRLLGARFGDGGPGFVHVVPLPGAGLHRAVRRSSSGAWQLRSVASPFPPDRLLGLGGGSAESSGGGVRLAPVSRVVTRAEVYYLAQPGGGALDLRVDGAAVAAVATGAAVKKAGFAAIPVGHPLGWLDLRAVGRVRLFGVVLEAARGVVVDNLGIVNATVRGWAANRAYYWRAQLAHRAPDSVVIMLGANEAGWIAGAQLDAHARLMSELLAPVRAARPDASCLVVSPLDQVDYERHGLPPRPAVVPMVAAQRRAARAAGCAFWDAYAWMGGAGSSRLWRRRGWMLRDFTHPTPGGGRRIADALAAGLLDGYARSRRP